MGMAMAVGNEEGLQINGDVLETIFSHVPLVDLVSASHVCNYWRAAVWSSLHHRNRGKPWLIIHTQATRFPYATTTHAYDPRSDIWFKISQPSIQYISTLKSSQSNFVYMLSPSKFSFSFDPFKSDWWNVDPPRVWRTDPIVARVGDTVVIAGGACDFEDDPLAVEIYNLETRVWCRCESMPANLKDSAASTWLTTAATSEKLIVADKQSGVAHWFDPELRSWSEPFDLNPGQSVRSYSIGCSNNSLILVGICRIGNDETVKIWRSGDEYFLFDEIGEMPVEYVNRLKGKVFGNCSVDIRLAGNIVYVYNSSEAEEVVACELVEGGGCRWWRAGNAVAREGMTMERLVFSCSEVRIDELRRVITKKGWRFDVSWQN